MGTELSNWLTARFLEWQRAGGKRQTVTAFAVYLGVSRDVLNQWLNGRRSPSVESAETLAEKLGPEIFDVLGLPRPDPTQQSLIRFWGYLTNADIKTIERIVKGAKERGEADARDGAAQPKRAR